MDLGLQERRAIVRAPSREPGFACATARAREGVHLLKNGRDPEALDQAAKTIRSEARGIDAQTVAGDISDTIVRTAL